MKRLFKQFSFPGGIPSHVAPETPGSIHEGGELGYSLSHAYGAAFDNPDLIVACVVGDGEAETGPLATSWHSNKFLEPGDRRRGAADPAPQRLQDRQPDRPGPHQPRGAGAAVPRLRLHALFRRGRRPGGDAPADGRDARHGHRPRSSASRPTRGETASPSGPRWPMIVLRTPKGWTGPKEVDGKQTEGYWRSHQVPMAEMHGNPEHVEHPRAVDEELPARGAVRRQRPAASRAGRAGAAGRAPHERQPARQRRPAAARPAAARLPRLRRRGAGPRRRRRPRPPASWASSCAT